MIINTNLSALHATNVQNESANPLQFTIDLIRADCAMFEAVVNCDVAQIMNESGQISISESEMNTILESTGNGIIAKIKELIAKAKEAIKKFIIKIQQKFEDVFSKDKRIYEKYAESFKNVINDTSIAMDKEGEFEIPNYDTLDTILMGKKVGSIEKLNLMSTLTKVKSIRDESEFEKIVKDFNDTCTKEKEELNELSKKLTVKKSGFLISLVTNEGLQRIEENIKFGKSKRLKAVRAFFESQSKHLDSIKSTINLEKLEGRGYDSYLDKKAGDSNKLSGSVAKYNAIFSIINATQQVINATMNCELNAMKKEYAVERKLFVQIATMNKKHTAYDKPKSDEKDKGVKKESFELWALGEMSDMCIEEAFASL